jgi:acylphosphatase
MMTMEYTRVEVRVFGRVQGVGFRYFATEEAQLRGLQGWARNLPDGTVEVIVQGPGETIEAYLEALRQAPPPAHVTHIRAEAAAPDATLQGFSIRR